MTTSSSENKKNNVPSRGWMVTINNPVIPGDAYLAQWLADGNIVFGCGQKEKSPSGTPHLQLYVVTKPNPNNKNGYGVKWMKENIHSSAHLDKRLGTHEEAKDYCTLPEYKGKKKEVLAGPWTVGSWDEKNIEGKTKGGKAAGNINKSKIEQVKKMIDEGARDDELYDAHFNEMLRYSKNFERYRTVMKDKSRDWQTVAMCLYGPPGTGKSKKVYDMARAKYGEDFYPLSLEGDKVWWDGYSGQKCVIIEEFYGNMKISYLLKLLDRYPLLVQTKGGMTPFLAETIFFTSNEHPDNWYSGSVVDDLDPLKRTSSKIPQNVLDALKRRFTGKCGTIKELKDQLVVPNDAPDADVLFAEYEALAAAPTPSSTPSPIDIRRAQQLPIDLTQDDDEERTLTSSQEEFLDLLDCEHCGVNARNGCACGDDDYEEQEDGYVHYDPDQDVQGFLRNQEAVSERLLLQRRNAMTAQTTQPPAPRKRAAEFQLIPPPNAPASEFKKLKQIPGQSKLVIATQRDDDDDVDDK